MNNFNPYITADGSIGLYNKDFDDIYHSAEGALSESLEKFILPVNYDVLLKYNNINVLDICYGIGCNTKTFLNFLYKNQKKLLKLKQKINSSHAEWYDTIHTDNIIHKNNIRNNETIYTDKTLSKNNNYILNKYNETVYNDKIFKNIYIKAVDNDKTIPFFSPILKSNIKYSKKIKNKYIIPNHKLDRYLKNKIKQKLKIHNFINYSIMDDLLSCYPDAYNNNDVINIIKEYRECFSSQMLGILNFLINIKGIVSHNNRLFSNLHNIYYRYISNRHKKALNNSKIGDITFELKIDDARNTIKSDNLLYNLIFLDAFTPTKCPCLWSYQFFLELYRLLADDGMLLTYSTSVSVRSAMKEAGFYIGYIYNLNKDKVIGTIASKNIALIKYPLSDYDLGLLNTTAGIFYRDENLTGQNEAIIAAHNLDIQKSNRVSSTSYIKQYKKESECMML